MWQWLFQADVNLDICYSLQWRHNERDGVSNQHRLDCLLNRLFRRRPKKTSKLRVTGLCDGNPPVTDRFSLQRASNSENVSIWFDIIMLSFVIYTKYFRHLSHGLCVWCVCVCVGGGVRFKNMYELFNLRALKFSHVNKIHICQCMGKIFCVEFQRYPLKFHTKYLTHTLKDMIFIRHWNFKSS